MTKLELQDAFDVIQDAHAMREFYPEQFNNDHEAMKAWPVLNLALNCAVVAASAIQDKMELWDDMAKAIRRKDEGELIRLQREQSGV